MSHNVTVTLGIFLNLCQHQLCIWKVGMRAFLQGFWRIKWILPAEFLGHFLGSSKILRSTCSMQDVNVVVTAACWTVVLGQRLARGAGPASVCYTERRARGRGAFGFLHRGFNLRPFIQTTLVVYPGLSLSRRCSSGSRVFTPDLEKATFRQGQDLELERGEKMSFDLFILTFAFFLRAPIIFSSGNCFMCLTDQLTHLQELSLTAMSLKLWCKTPLVTSAGPQSLTVGSHSFSALSAKKWGKSGSLNNFLAAFHVQCLPPRGGEGQ